MKPYNKNQQCNNIPQVFMNNQQIINKPDFTNRGNMIHNNMGEILRDQKITEYKIHINSIDRDVIKFPSPFNFKIPFGSTQSFKIDKKFTQVKYISIDAIILPRDIAIDVSKVSDQILYPAGTKYKINDIEAEKSTNLLTTLTSNKYLVLKIEELENSRNMGTSTQIDSNTFILYHDKHMGIDGNLWRPIHGTVVYYSSQPFNLYNMSVKLYDFMNNEIKIVDHNGNDIIKNNITGTDKNYNNYVKNYYNSNSVVYTDNVTQLTLMLTVGVIENEMTINN